MSDAEPPALVAGRDHGRIGDRVLASAALLWSTAMLLRVLQLATTVILARILNPNDYGIVALATTIVGFIDLMSNLQIGGAVTRSEDPSPDRLDTAFTLNLIRGALTGIVLVAVAWPLASFMREPRLTGVLCAFAIPAVVGSIHNPHFLLFARNIDFKRDSQ